MLTDLGDRGWHHQADQEQNEPSSSLFGQPIKAQFENSLALELIELFGPDVAPVTAEDESHCSVEAVMDEVHDDKADLTERTSTSCDGRGLKRNLEAIIEETKNPFKKVRLKSLTEDEEQSSITVTQILNEDLIVSDTSDEDSQEDAACVRAEPAPPQRKPAVATEGKAKTAPIPPRNPPVEKCSPERKQSDEQPERGAGLKVRIRLKQPSSEDSPQRPAAMNVRRDDILPRAASTNRASRSDLTSASFRESSRLKSRRSSDRQPEANVSQLSPKLTSQRLPSKDAATSVDGLSYPLEIELTSMDCTALDKKAADLKHRADKMGKCATKILCYLESICYFGAEAELNYRLEAVEDNRRSDTLVRDTIELLRFNHTIAQEVKSSGAADKAFVQKFELLDQLITCFIYQQRWRYSLNQVRKLSGYFADLCGQIDGTSPLISPTSVRSGSTGSASPSSGHEFRRLCENLLRIVDRPACSYTNWKRAQHMIENSPNAKAFLRQIESRYKKVNYADNPIECYTFLLTGIMLLKKDLDMP